MRRRGLSMIETLVAVVIIAVAMGGVVNAFISGIGFETRFGKKQDARFAQIQLEDKISRLIAGADLHETTDFFVSPVPSTQSGQQPPIEGGLGPGSSSLVITTWGEAPSAQFLSQSGSTFESMNSRFGPQGGKTEVAFSTIPVGLAGNKRGLFLREQRPPDSDPSQGGEESLLTPNLRDIRFEFYDGTNWQTAWDTQNDQKGKLPSVVRVTYLLNDDPAPHQFLVRVPLGQSITSGGNGS